MPKEEWGLCKDCKWWQIEPKGSAENLTLGLCIDEKLQSFRLRVSGNSGCNRFMPGKPGEGRRVRGGTAGGGSSSVVKTGTAKQERAGDGNLQGCHPPLVPLLWRVV